MYGIVSQHCHILLSKESDPVRWGCHLRRWVCSLRISSLQPTQAYLWQGRRAFAKSHQSVPRCVRLFSQSLTEFSVCSCSVLFPGFTHKGSETLMISWSVSLPEPCLDHGLDSECLHARSPECAFQVDLGRLHRVGSSLSLQWSEGSSVPLTESGDLCLFKCLQLF